MLFVTVLLKEKAFYYLLAVPVQHEIYFKLFINCPSLSNILL